MLLDRLKGFALPAGEAAARGVRGFRTSQRGRIRAAPDAKWNAFSAEERVDAMATAFCWEARIGTGVLSSVQVTDAYEHGLGRLVLHKGPLPLKRLTGPDVDAGEIQRYLAYAGCFPAMLVNNPALEFLEQGPSTLRARDRDDPGKAHVDIEMADDGRPIVTRAVRPMTAGRRIVFTPWSARSDDYREVEGMRIPHRMDAAWDPPGGAFTYVEIELVSVQVLR